MRKEQNKQNYKISDLIAETIRLQTKYASVDDWTKKEYEHYSSIRDRVLLTSGLDHTELTIIIALRQAEPSFRTTLTEMAFIKLDAIHTARLTNSAEEER